MKDKPEVNNDNIGKISTDAARSLVGVGDSKLQVSMGGNKSKKKSLLFLATFLVFGLALASFFIFFRDSYNASAENWPLLDKETGLRAKPVDVALKEGRVDKPTKILEVQLSIDDNATIATLGKITRKNGHAKPVVAQDGSWRAELVDDAGKVISENNINIAYVIEENGRTPEGNVPPNNKAPYFSKQMSVNLLWGDAAKSVNIYNSNGDLLDSREVKNPTTVDNKQDYQTVSGKDMSPKKSSFINKLRQFNKAEAQTPNGVVDLVFVSQGYTATNMAEFDLKVGQAINALSSIEPLKSRWPYFRINLLRTTQDYGCVGPNIPGEFPTYMNCGNWSAVASAVNDRAMPYDHIMVIKKSSSNGGTASFPGWWSIATSHDGYSPEIFINSVIHELGHNFGLYDEYTANRTATTLNIVTRNCYQGPPNASFPELGCGTYDNWSRTTKDSTMRSFPPVPNYNAISQSIVAKYLDSLIDTKPPTVSINPLNTNVSTSSVTSLTPTTITVNATDNMGISKVELYADNSLVSSDATSPYSYTWDPSVISIKGAGAITANAAYAVQVTGIANVPKGTGYVAMNLTVVNPSSSGNIMAYPCDGTRPATSNINFLANSVSSGVIFSKISSSGTVCLLSNFNANIVVDVVGYQALNTNYSDLGPSKRILDTRTSNKINAAGSVQTVQIGGVQSIPPTATGVHLNVVAVLPKGAGEMTIYPCDKTRPTSPNAIYGSGNTTSVVSFLQMSATGTVCIFTSAEAHLVVDGYGYFTSQNQYTYLPDVLKVAASSSLTAGKSTSFSLNAKASGYSTGSKAAYGTVTVLNPTENGNLSIYPCDKPYTTSSVLNYYSGVKKTSAFISGIALDGSICAISTKNIAVNIDVIGIFGPNTSFTALPPTRILDTRTGTITKTSFQSGVRELFAKAYDISGKSTTSTVIKVTY